ncbi:MAG: DUF1641 domain-containing protein [Halanaeroarchaeum sp.]
MSNDASTLEEESAALENAMETMLELEQSGSLDDLADAANTISLVADAMDDEMVISAMDMGSTLAEAGDGMATEGTVRMAESVGENADDLNAALEKMVQLEQDGTLDDLLEASNAISLAGDAIDDEMIVSLMGMVGDLGQAADGAAQTNAIRTFQAMTDALDEAADFEAAEPVGMVGMLKMMRDPEVQQGMGFLLSLMKAFGHQIDRRKNAYEQ